MSAEAVGDIELLERILLKLALIDDDNELQNVVARFLVPVVHKISSPQPAVQKKVLEVLTHINKRVKPHQAIQLPLEQLLDRFLDASASVAEKNFAMLYLDMGLERSELKTQQFIVYTLLSHLGSMSNSSSSQHIDTTLQLFLSACDKLKLNTKEQVFDAATKQILLDFIYDVILYLPLVAPPAQPAQPDAAGAAAGNAPAPAQDNQPAQSLLPPGMSEKSRQRVLGTTQAPGAGRFSHWKVDDWAQKKTYLCTDFLLEGALHGVFTESEVFVPLLLASADGNARVQRAGEDALKRLPRFMLEERPIVDKLYLIISGNGSNAKLPAAEKRSPASNIVRVKAFEQLVRSQTGLNSFPQNLQAAFEALFGATTTPKLKMQGLGFIQAVIRSATDLTMKLFGPVVLSGALLKLLREISKDQSTQNAQLRAGVYQSIGALSKRVPALFSSNLDLLKEFFDVLPTETEVSVRVTVQEALADLSAAFAPKATADKSIADSIHVMLLNIVENRQDAPSRYLAVFYANRLFPFADARARLIDLICASDMQRQVSDEARRGLVPFKCVDNNPVPDPSVDYPDFADFMARITQTARKNRDSAAKGQPRASFSQLTMKELMEFVRLMLQHDLQRPGASANSFLDSIKQQDPHPLALFRDLVLEALAPTSTVDVIHSSARALLDMFCAFPEWSISFFSSSAQHQQALLQLMSRGRPESRRLIAKCVALVVPNLPSDSRTQIFKDQLAILATGRSVLRKDEQIGACLTLGAAISRCVETQLGANPKSNAFEFIGTALVCDIVNTLRSWTELETNYSEPAAEALGQIGRFAPLPVESSVVNDIISSIAKQMGTPGVATEAVETFAVALANLAMGDRSLASNQTLLDAIYSTNKIKQEELHFTVGDSLSCIGAGWLSSASADPLLPESMTFASLQSSLREQDVSTDRIEPILNKLLESFILGDRADARAAAAIWLLCLLKSAGSTSTSIKKQLKRIQTAFSHLLAENNEVVQEAAAKGIVLVYELGDATTQNSLIDTLVSTLQTGAKGFKMTEDTEILPDTAQNAPKSSPAQSSSSSSSSAPQLSTYKELLSLASEMNQPDLVYRFMNLSTHHALWNSKKGAAFATKTLAAKAADKLKPQLPELIPKLFRASYDPNPKIAASMTNILNALVEDTNQITAADSPYFAAIMKDLIDNMFNKQWRTRESCCLALSDILISKTFAQVGPFLSELWEKCFKVLDDIKETVRKAAEQLCKSLSSLTLRLCDPSYTNIEDGRRAVDIALPFLLKRGLISEVQAVRYLAASLIQKISKAAGFLLKPHIAVLVETMMDSLTALEPTELNYLSLNADKAGIKQDDIDAARVEISKLSPVNDTLDFCLKQIDKENIVELAPKLSTTLTSAIGVASRMGAAQFITQLCLRKPEEAALAAPTLLPALRKGAVSSNRTGPARKAFANALGQMARVAGSSGKKNLLAQTVNLLLDGYRKAEGDDANGRIAAGEVLLELCRSASSVLQPYYKEIVPVIFLARYDTASEDAKKLFGQIWEEIGASIGLYLAEVVDLLVVSLDDSRWTMKQQAAIAVASLADLVNDYQLKSLAGKLLKPLVAGLRGRIWTGKDSFFDAIAKILETCKNLYFDSQVAPSMPTQEEVLKAMLIEAKKKNMAYKKSAIIALASVLHELSIAANVNKQSSANNYLQVQETLLAACSTRHDLLEESEEGSATSTTSTQPKEIEKDENANSLSVRMNAIKALSAAWPYSAPATLQPHLEAFIALLRKEMDASPQFTMRIASLNALKTLLPKLDLSSNAPHQLISDAVFDSILDCLLNQVVDPNYSSVRSLGVDVLYELVSRSLELKCLQTRGAKIREALKDAAKRFSASVGAGSERILQILDEEGYPSKRPKNM